ncbi:histone-lysine N-methyltransferase 2B isoform X36 [Molothrus ater]|uniref:histone-lysine N-methyltransferase 2B isoform X36 n=1 Tax=Molothrus ater TaxID=84834 RepID=UPI0023E8803E|nr:histone-lysine N-methyltransferase 2B isoform X36 [Molothrus ater]
MGISGTFRNLPEPSQLPQNLPRAAPSSWGSATPPWLGNREFLMGTSPGTFQNLPRSLRTFPDPPEPSQIPMEPSGTFPDPPEPSQIPMEPSGTFLGPSEPSQILQNHHRSPWNLPELSQLPQSLPRAAPSSWCSATPSWLGNREFLMGTSAGTFQNLPRSLRTFPDPPEPSQIPMEPSGTFPAPTEPSQILQNHHRSPWNLPELSRTIVDPLGTFQNLPKFPQEPPRPPGAPQDPSPKIPGPILGFFWGDFGEGFLGRILGFWGILGRILGFWGWILSFLGRILREFWRILGKDFEVFLGKDFGVLGDFGKDFGVLGMDFEFFGDGF